ncbi:MAG: 3-deoxy-D-manno-octulosonic acid transferase [Phycisphaerales bacterium]
MNALDLVYLPLAALTAPWWARKTRADWPARFGKMEAVADRGMPRVLLHAVSVGETNALRQLVPRLAERAHVIVSVGTDTGIKRARELYSGVADVVRYPLDFSWAVGRFLEATRPDVVGLVELEVWPNFVGACRRRGIPVAVINGRLSERSFKGYRRLRAFFRGPFGAIALVAAQEEDYAARFEAMGVSRDRIRVTGSMKWDATRIEDEVVGSELLARDLGIARGPGAPPLVVAGSTGPGEEALMAGACAEVEREIGPVQLLCAPRKPERFDDAATALGECVRRSATPGADRASDRSVAKTCATNPVRESRRFLLDTIGELRQAYSLADVVVVGRSFGDLFGSDPIEPIALGKATVIGPAVSDFAAIVAEFERGGGLVRATRETLAGTLARLLKSAAERAALAEAGRACIRARQGASLAHAEMLMGLVSRVRPRRPSA